MSNYFLTSFVFAVVVLGIFFFSFEKRKPSARDILPIIIICVIASLGRVIFAFIPGVQPVTALVIITGICYGKQPGFITGALCAIISDIFMGQGPWTPWQMLAWGTIGLIAGFFPEIKTKFRFFLLLIYSFIAGFLYSMIMDVWTVSTLGESLNLQIILTTYAMGLLYNIPHSIGNVIFMIILFIPFSKKLIRLKTKYGILSGKGAV